jgi:hypothetical protein
VEGIKEYYAKIGKVPQELRDCLNTLEENLKA